MNTIKVFPDVKTAYQYLENIVQNTLTTEYQIKKKSSFKPSITRQILGSFNLCVV